MQTLRADLALSVNAHAGDAPGVCAIRSRLSASTLLAPLAARVPFDAWPAVAAYDALLPHAPPVATRAGKRVHFVAQSALTDALGYEQRIYQTGAVATRERNWHDLFNALAWATFPKAKAALNARHHDELHRAKATQNRGRARDALTLLDESGLIVASDAADLLTLIREMRWKELFWQRRSEVCSRMRFFLFGHGLCEQALQPYIGLTAKALLFETSPQLLAATQAAQIGELDARIARWCDAARLSPTLLHPLPVLGIPGWWPDNEHARFYDNSAYFRSERTRQLPFGTRED